MSKTAARFSLYVTLLLLLSACSGTSPDQAGTSQDQAGSTPSVTVNAAEPPTENTAVAEKPLPPQEAKPGIALVSLPIGGADNTGGPCVQVNWSGGDIPEGYGAQVQEVKFEGEAYHQTGSRCPGPACIGHIFRAGDLECDLAITPTDPSARGTIEGDEVSVSMPGRVLCPDPGAAECTAFKKLVHDLGPSMTVPRPAPPSAPPVSNGSGATTPSTTTESSTTTDSSTTNSSTDSSTTTATPGG